MNGKGRGVNYGPSKYDRKVRDLWNQNICPIMVLYLSHRSFYRDLLLNPSWACILGIFYEKTGESPIKVHTTMALG